MTRAIQTLKSCGILVAICEGIESIIHKDTDAGALYILDTGIFPIDPKLDVLPGYLRHIAEKKPAMVVFVGDRSKLLHELLDEVIAYEVASERLSESEMIVTADVSSPDEEADLQSLCFAYSNLAERRGASSCCVLGVDNSSRTRSH